MHRLKEGPLQQSMQFLGKPSVLTSRVLNASIALLSLCCLPGAFAQSSSSNPPAAPAPPKSPALVDTTGPDISLQNSEALFDIAAALNSCGYDQGLATSDPVRQEVRDLVNQALQSSADARHAHDDLCTLRHRHRLSLAAAGLLQG